MGGTSSSATAPLSRGTGGPCALSGRWRRIRGPGSVSRSRARTPTGLDAERNPEREHHDRQQHGTRRVERPERPAVRSVTYPRM
jgi:hypothetical protein